MYHTRLSLSHFLFFYFDEISPYSEPSGDMIPPPALERAPRSFESRAMYWRETVLTARRRKRQE